MSLNVVFESGRLADFREGEEEAVGVHDEVFVAGFLVDFGQVGGPSALRVPSGFGADSGVFFPCFKTVFERIQSDFGRNVREHHVDERRGDRFDFAFSDQFAEEGEDGRSLLIHHFQSSAGSFERDFVIAVADEFKKRTVAVFADPCAALRVELRILNVRMRHKNDLRFVRHLFVSFI